MLLKAIVNNAFRNRYPRTLAETQLCSRQNHWLHTDTCPYCSMEVGVRAEAHHEEGPNRHINSAFMTFEVLDDGGKPRTLPRIRPEPLVS